MEMTKKKIITLSLCTAFLLNTNLLAKDKNISKKQVSLGKVSIVEQRANRKSKGALGLPLDIKDTPQSISIMGSEEMAIHGVTSSNKALDLMTGVNVEQYETKRANFNSRGFEIQLTQVDGLGMTNDFAVVVGENDTFMFEKIELIRGANGLLTGVGNSSGTINYVRKRPINKDAGILNLSAGSYKNFRGAIDYNKVLTKDGNWAGRIVFSKEKKESHIRDLKDEQTSVYAVVDGQIGNNGILTTGISYTENEQDSPMWGSLTLNYLKGGYADFPISSSTSSKWSYWDTKNTNAFVEYLHEINDSWQVKLTYNWNKYDSESKLLYGYTQNNGLNDDNTGLIGWPYAGFANKESHLVDLNINGDFEAFDNTHTLLAGISYTDEDNSTHHKKVISGGFLPYPKFDDYNGDSYAEPVWGKKEKRSSGNKKLTRFYLASRLGITEKLHGILGVNIIKLEREGSLLYGNVSNALTVTKYPELKETSPYFGLTYDVTENTLLYASYSNIFQNQDEKDFNGRYLDPMEGVNYEVGIKSEFFDKKLLTSLAFFNAEQKGLAVASGKKNTQGEDYSLPIDIDSKGVEFETTGRITDNTRVGFGITHLKLKGKDDKKVAPWIPRTTVNLRADTKFSQIPELQVGMNAKWRSDAYKEKGARQNAFVVANAFGSYKLSKQATLRLNVNNIFNKKYVEGLVYGAIYGAPRNGKLTLEYKF